MLCSRQGTKHVSLLPIFLSTSSILCCEKKVLSHALCILLFYSQLHKAHQPLLCSPSLVTYTFHSFPHFLNARKTSKTSQIAHILGQVPESPPKQPQSPTHSPTTKTTTMHFHTKTPSLPPLRPISPLNTSPYEKPYTRLPPPRSSAGPSNLHQNPSPNTPRRSPPHRNPNGPENLAVLTRTTVLPKPSLPALASQKCHGPDFTSKPVVLDELDGFGMHAPVVRPNTRQGGEVEVKAGKSVLRTGAERQVRLAAPVSVESLRGAEGAEGIQRRGARRGGARRSK